MDPKDLVVGGRIHPNWMLDGVSFWYADGMPENTTLYRVAGQTGEIAPLFDLAKTRRALARHIGHDPPNRGLPFDSIVELGGDRFQFAYEATTYVLATADYTIEVAGADSNLVPSDRPQLAGEEGAQTYLRPMWLVEPQQVKEVASPNRGWFASVKDGNIMLRSQLDGRIVPLTFDGTPQFGWDIEAPRFKRSLGVAAGFHLLDPWSPDGYRLFALKVDRRAVPEVPFVRYLKRDPEYCSLRIPRAGGPIYNAHPHLIDVLTRRTSPFDLGDTEDQFFTLVGWLPRGNEVLFTRHSRDFKAVDVLAGNLTDGSVRTVLAERAESFVAIQHEVIYQGNNHVTILEDPPGLIWRSSRSGWNHLYLYAIDGSLARALTKGEFPVIDVVAVDQGGDWIYFTAHHDEQRPYDTHLCRVRLTGSEIERLTELDGENVVSVSPSKTRFTAVNSRPDRPFRTDFYTCDGKHLAVVQQADVRALRALGHVAAEEFSVKAADGETMLWGVMHRPAEFDPAAKYPVIDHLYGGPQVSTVVHGFGVGEDGESKLDCALAQLGYVVISVDARGTPERSKAFQDVVYRNWGQHEIPDHIAALQQLAQRHAFIDLDRVGVWGHSWGGYFAIRALAQAPDLFRAGVASAPGTDPYDLFLYEPYLDLPIRARAAYDFAGLYSWAPRIKGALMMVVGTSDPICYSFTVKMAHHMIQAGVEHELVVLPDARHGFQGKEYTYFVRKLVEHFQRYLRPNTPGS